MRAALKRSMQAAKEYAEAEKARIQEERDVSPLACGSASASSAAPRVSPCSAQAARARREERKRRREENEYKNASYQVVRFGRTLKSKRAAVPHPPSLPPCTAQGP